MSSSSKKPQGPAQGVLDGVVGHHLACARVTTHVTFLKHFGQPYDLRPVEYSLLMLLAANAQLTPKQLAQSLALSAPNLTSCSTGCRTGACSSACAARSTAARST